MICWKILAFPRRGLPVWDCITVDDVFDGLLCAGVCIGEGTAEADVPIADEEAPLGAALPTEKPSEGKFGFAGTDCIL